MVNKKNILVFSNSETYLDTFQVLYAQDYTVKIVQNKDECISELKRESYLFLFLDLVYKDFDGISLTIEIRSNTNLYQPYIYLFSENHEEDYVQITAYNAGVDEFLKSSVKSSILLARLNSLAKRQVIIQEIPPVKSVDDFYIDEERYTIIFKDNEYYLPKIEFQLLKLLFEKRDRVVSKKDIAQYIWNDLSILSKRTIDIHIRNIRKTIGSEIIKTYKGNGYAFVFRA